MLQHKKFVKKTKQNKIVQVSREHYLRDDIWSGTPLDPESDAAANKLSATAKHYLVVDTNVALSQIDFLEHAAVDDVIIMSVVLEEVRHRNASVYQRLRRLVESPAKRFFVFVNEHHRETYIKADVNESPNDRNDRAIRIAAAWYMRRVPGMPIIVLTNDAENRRKALEMGINAMSVQAYARSLPDAPELADITAVESNGQAAMDIDGGAVSKGKKRKRIYEDHRPMSSIAAAIKQGTLHQGSLRVNRFNPYEGYVGSESVGQDILLAGRTAMNRALDGDIVAVELLPEEQWVSASAQLRKHDEAEPNADEASQPTSEEEEDADMAREGGGASLAPQVAPGEHYDDISSSSSSSKDKRPTGRVVGIIRRNWRTRGYSGSLQPDRLGRPAKQGPSNVLFCPVERRYPFIRIQTRQADTLADKRLVVAIDSWEVDSAYPSGHYVRTLGTIGDKDTETEVLLLENDINTSPFSPAVHACVPPLPWSVTEADLNDPNREDLRHLPICSVDPPGCKDIDDALHMRPLPNGTLELGVHIADVTHFLHPATAMDTEAASRATTTYLVQRRIDMLPKPLTEDICSLRAGVERLAFSVLWEITKDARIVSVRFTKSVIKSRAALTYAEAQSRIDDERLQDELSVNLRRMNAIARVLRRQRSERGALQLASPEVKFEIDTETHDPLDVGMYQVREANQMVEEMMLLANVTVAEHVLSHFATCTLLRRHQVPPPRQFEPLLKAASAAHFSIDISSSKTLAESLDLAQRPEDAYFNKLVRIMATRCMTQAAYFGSGEVSPPEYYHYGLAAPLYTHFTSPIRRYADVVVHRLLAAAIGLNRLPEDAKDGDRLHALAGNLNLRHRNAQMAGRASVELHTLIFFKDREVIADARVTRVRANGLVVFVPKYGIEGPVYLTEKAKTASMQGIGAGNTAAKPGSEDFQLDEDQQMLASKDGKVQIKIFDKAAVRISVVEGTGHRRQLLLQLVDRALLPQSELASV
ncbi:g4534 [Coccomyxa viridis]|uniref:G4534 protein n=1 Tax=Coccomyxa viridis TaxID=1274662 RepID=A0ABP1FQK0_9CHLO